LAEIHAPAAIADELERYAVHPALLDAFGQALPLALPEGDPRASSPFFMEGLERVVVHRRAGPRAFSHLVLRPDAAPHHVTGDVRVYDEAGGLVAEMLGLRLRFLDAFGEMASRVEDWLHELRWDVRPLPPTAPDVAPCAGWLILSDAAGVGAALAERLRASGERAVLVESGLASDVSGGPGPRWEPLERGSARALLADVMGASRAGWRVVHLLGLDAPAGQATVDEVEGAALRACGSALHLIQELTEPADPARLWVVTRGAQAVGEETVSAAQATLWGLGTVISAEHPEAWGGLIDLDPAASARDCAAVLADGLRRPDGESQTAWRKGVRHVARLARGSRPEAPAAPPLSPSASYLITGGLGDLGLRVARWMVERGARRLVLMGRTLLPPRRAWATLPEGSPLTGPLRAVRELESLGASVHLARVDVGDEAALRDFLEGFAAEGWPAIRGVIHAAGVQHPAPLRELEVASLKSDFRAKVRGGWLLAEALGRLDFLVFFSSAATLLGSPFLGGYAAANAFLDALAQDLRARGAPALAIDWGFWSELGMAARYGREQGRRFIPRGARDFSAADGLRALERLLAGAPARAGVLAMDWPEWRRCYPGAAASPFLSDLMGEDAPPSPAGAPAEPAAPREAFRDAPEPERRRLLEELVPRLLARVLRLPASRIEPDQPLVWLGLDSLTAVELRNRLRTELGVTVPIVKILACPGTSQLVADLLELTRPEPRDDDWEVLTL
jgi:myxalamid-type polyketide synthase MxaE and MxaD